jgi:hypothetical protein
LPLVPHEGKSEVNKRSKTKDKRDEGRNNRKDQQNPYPRGSLTQD